MKEIKITKRNGNQEPLDINKIHRVVSWACEGAYNVSASEIEQEAQIKFFNGMQSAELHEALINSAHDLINDDNEYDLVAGRLMMFDLRKRAYGKFEPNHLLVQINQNMVDGWYDKDILNLYSEKEWDKLNSYIKHDRDFNIRIAGADEWKRKYLVQNRSTKEIKESPQIAYMLISAILMHKYGNLSLVKKFYDDISTGITSLPTPILAGVRTKTKQFSSCVLIECGDSLDSISATIDASIRYASRKAGLGINVSSLRGESQSVRGGEATTTGPIPFTQAIQQSILSCSQGGLRKGSVTFYHWMMHIDIEKLLVLKNNKGTEETRVRHSDHGFLINGFIYKKMMKNEPMFLFSPEEVPDLYEAFFADQQKFEELYEKYSRARKITKKQIMAGELRDLLITERYSTGRVYIFNVDLANQQGPFIPEMAPIRQSNLCNEIALPTFPLRFYDDPDGLIALCTLAAINWGMIRKVSDFEGPCYRIVLALDSLLDYQQYPLKAAENHTKRFRPLGIGVNNLAYFLAKNNLKYDESALPLVNQYMEAMTYYLMSASVDLALEYGPCDDFEKTKYANGILPVDVRKKAIDDYVEHVENFNWDEMREVIKHNGIRNSTLIACMPSETSSKLINSTNGVEPIRGMVVTKNKKVVAPESYRLKNRYHRVWDQGGPQGYLKVMGTIQKWTDQSISVNTTYNIDDYENSMIPGKVIFGDILLAYKLGLKSLYYNNNLKKAEIEKDESDDTDCESCKI